jgi:dolichol kinase
MSTLKKEILRKLIHLIEVPIIVGYTIIHFYFSPKIGVLSLTGLLLLLLEIEYFRIDYETRLGAQITEFFSKFILRKHERNNIVGAIFFVVATIIAFSVFDYPIALLALLLTVFGDLAAAIMGIAFGSKKIFRNKSYIGTFSGLIVNILIGLIIIPTYPQVFLPMAFTASIVETLTQKLDDNLTVPLFAGFIGQVIIVSNEIVLPPFF